MSDLSQSDSYGPRPQIITRTVPSHYNHAVRERIPERTFEDVTGWWEMKDGPLQALAQTADGCRQMIERMKNKGTVLERSDV